MLNPLPTPNCNITLHIVMFLSIINTKDNENNGKSSLPCLSFSQTGKQVCFTEFVREINV
jgi:hypothetical protein